MEVSDNVLLAIITAVPTTLAALGALAVSIRNGQKVDIVDTKAVQITALVDGHLSKVTSQLEVANTKLEGFSKAQEESGKKIAGLEKLVNDFMMRGNIGAVADADRVQRVRATDAVGPIVAPAVAPIVEAIAAVDAKVDRVETKVDVVVDSVAPKPPTT